MKNNNLLIIFIIIILVLLSLGIKVFHTDVTELLFEENLEILNKVTQVTSYKTLSYYLGEMEKLVFGPWNILLLGLAYLLLPRSGFAFENYIFLTQIIGWIYAFFKHMSPDYKG